MLDEKAATDWMNRQATTRGFFLRSLTVEDYHTLRIKRERGNSRAIHGILDLRGALDVSEPNKFLSALSKGFGRAKAWGCGLMLIRRIP